MEETVITGLALSSCLGALEDTWQAMLRGQSGLRTLAPFPGFDPYPLGLTQSAPTPLEQLIPPLVDAVLEDAGLAVPLTSCAVALGSSRGFQSQWERFLTPPYPVIQNWLETLPQQAALWVHHRIESQELVLSPMAACASGLQAIIQAAELIRQGRVSLAIAGGVEAPLTPLTLAGFQQMGALARRGCFPFDLNREGLALGEGGALLVLESRRSALARGAGIYARISGWGLTCDGSHVSRPALESDQAKKAVVNALCQSRVKAEEIDFIHAHGTGTRLNDHREGALIQALFPPQVGVWSSKGAIGHTLGASGALGAVLSGQALREGILPATVGLQAPEFPLHFGPAQGHWRRSLVLCFGFGGQNGALLLEADCGNYC
ncbi:MAG: beta-ketoacyl-ACP synthase [Cyanobacteriota bacterium]